MWVSSMRLTMSSEHFSLITLVTKMSSTSPPRKRKRYYSKFNADWLKAFDFLHRSKKGEQYAFCTFCHTDFSISHGGKNDIEKHRDTEKHRDSYKRRFQQSTLKTMFNKDSGGMEDKVCQAEVMFVEYLVEHNLPFAAADHFTKIAKCMYSDSEIAKKQSCGRMKSTMIVKNCLDPTYRDPVVDHCRKYKFSLLIDESTDYGCDKCLVVLVRYFDMQHGAITRFLDMPVCNVGTGEAIFEVLDGTFRKFDIPWTNVVAFTSDNCNVMKGTNNSVLSRIKAVQPDVFDVGCICHLANLCCGSAVKQLPIAVDDLLIDIYFHFNKSTKRVEEFKEFAAFTEVDSLKILKHCTTRWLSLEKCVKRTLQQWPALQSYFASHKDVERAGGRVKKIAELLGNPEVKLYFLFLDFILTPLNEFNTLFQSDRCLMGCLKSEMDRLLRKFLAKFIKVSFIKENNADLTQLPFCSDEAQLPDDLIAVGMSARSYLAEEEENIPIATPSRFFLYVRKFYQAVVLKMMKKFPFKDTIIQDLGIIDPRNRGNVTAETALNLAKRFKILDDEDLDALGDECHDLCVSPDDDLPSFEDQNINRFWLDMSRMKLANDQLRFPKLCSIITVAMTIPNSNAECERVFSHLKKIQTSFRSELSNDTISSILATKLNNNKSCFESIPEKTTLRKAKLATKSYTNEHK